MTDYMALQSLYEFDVYPKRDIVLVRGKNAKVWDSEGREYIDCAGGHGTMSVGYCNDEVIAAVNQQMHTLTGCSGTFYNDRKAELLELLISIAPERLTRAFLCNSGTEAIEAALKFARLATGKTNFICAVRGFHGRTFGAMSATHEPRYQEGHAPLVPGFSYVPFNNFERLTAAVTDQTAAIVLEIVQGEGGVNIGTADYFACVQELCRSRGLLLIIDEVQTGFCRTGRMFACEHYGVQPDIMCVAKAIAGGLPMGAVLCSNDITASIGKHGSTFGGNPVVCAAAIAAIRFMQEHNLADAARDKGAFFMSRFPASQLPIVREVRQTGLMIGIELKTKAQPYLQALLQQGILALPAGSNVIRLLPPLTILTEELETAAETLITILKSPLKT